jgi:hypothetical protein
MGASPAPASSSRRVTGLWVYQSPDVVSVPPDPQSVVARATQFGLGWVTAQAFIGADLLDTEWLHAMRRVTTAHGVRLGVHGRIGKPHPQPDAEAQTVSDAIQRARADFVIVDAEDEYESAPPGTSKRFVQAYRRLRPRFKSYFSSFGRPSLHAGLDWKAWADADFAGMPQAYENLNAAKLRPSDCVDDWAQLFQRRDMRPTLGCFSEHGHDHLPTTRLVASVREVPELRFNVYRHGTVTDAEMAALAAVT